MPVQHPLEVLNDRVEGTVGVIRGTAQGQPWRAWVHHGRGEDVHQAGLANARLATQQHHLPVPVLALGPALPEQAHLYFTAHQRGEPRGSSHVQATLRRTLSHHLVDGTGMSMPLRAWVP